jgi:hypothetical protein
MVATMKKRTNFCFEYSLPKVNLIFRKNEKIVIKTKEIMEEKIGSFPIRSTNINMERK